MNIRVQRKDREIVAIELAGEWHADAGEHPRLVGAETQHIFTREGYYDHSEATPALPASPEPRRVDVGPSEGTACVP